MLVFGLGWTSQFLIPLLNTEKIWFAGTTTTGREGSYKFKFEYDPAAHETSSSEEDRLEQYRALPTAETLLITFPIHGKDAMKYFMKSYRETHDLHGENDYKVILLGSSGIWSIEKQDLWVTRYSRYNITDACAEAEDWVIQQGGCAMNLSGLWGGERQVWRWIDRVAATKEQLKTKT